MSNNIKYYAGCDPGLKGFIAVTRASSDNDLELIDKRPIPVRKAAGKGNEIYLAIIILIRWRMQKKHINYNG